MMIDDLDVKQRELLYYMAPPSPDNYDIQLTKAEIEAILSLGNEIHTGSYTDLQSLKKDAALLQDASGVVILFELDEDYPLIELTEWLTTVQDHMYHDADFLIGTKIIHNQPLKTTIIIVYLRESSAQIFKLEEDNYDSSVKIKGY